MSVLCSEFICKELDDVGPVDRLERENNREEFEPGRVGCVDGERYPLWGDTAAKREGGLLCVRDGRTGLEKIRLLDGGEDVEVGEGGDDEDAYDAFYG